MRTRPCATPRTATCSSAPATDCWQVHSRARLLLAARAAGARPGRFDAWTSFESLVCDALATDGHLGLASSMRHCGPPEKSEVSAATNAGASPPRIQTCESGGTLPSTEAIAPVT